MSSEPRSVFIRRFRYRARRFLPGPTRSPGLVTRLPVRPARFPVGLGEPVLWPDFQEAQSAPLLPAFYLGRVEEVTSEGMVLATLWERPSGRQMSTQLSVASHFQGTSPVPGDLLRIWTWVEVRETAEGQGERIDRTRVMRESPRLENADREELTALAAQLRLLGAEQEQPEAELARREAEWERVERELKEQPPEPGEGKHEA
jgi:hypothetical protein